MNALDSFLTAASDSQQGNRRAGAPPQMKAFQCFLFEQIMIFSEMVGKKTTFTSPSYEYKAHFMVSLLTFYILYAVEEICNSLQHCKYSHTWLANINSKQMKFHCILIGVDR